MGKELKNSPPIKPSGIGRWDMGERRGVKQWIWGKLGVPVLDWGEIWCDSVGFGENHLGAVDLGKVKHQKGVFGGNEVLWH